MPGTYYQNKIYPLQDKVLKTITEAGLDFYLTGGTALGRCYLEHRYSDDLDFFVNSHKDFKIQTASAVNLLKNQLLTYLKLTDKPLGLLINFNETLLKDGITRIINDTK